MKAVEVQRNLSMYGGASTKRAEAIGTVLRNANMLPLGGRGRHAPDITVEQAVMFGLAVAATENIVDAVSVARSLAELENKEGGTLLDSLSGFILDADAALTCDYVHLLPAINGAIITYVDGRREWFFEPSLWQDDKLVPSSQGQGFAGRVGYIGGSVIAQIANDFSDPVEAEWGQGLCHA